MALALIHDGRIRLETEYRERELCQEAGAKYDDDERVWYVPLSWASCVQLRGVFQERLQVGQDLSDWAAHELETRINPCLALRLATEATAEVDSAELLEPLQRVGVQFLATARQALCGDGMGSGKTVEAISAAETMAQWYGEDEVFPALVVCTNSMVWKWEEEILKWSHDRSVAVLKGGAATRRKKIEAGADWFVVNWEGLAGHSRLSKYGSVALTDKDKEEKELNAVGLRTVIADEAHRAKNPKSKQTRAWWWLSHRASNRIALTGTPVVRTPEDLWSIMHGVDPKEWPSKVAWTERYGLKSWNLFGGMSVVGLRGDTQAELFKFLDPRFIRRPTKAVIPNIACKLPPQFRYVELAPKQRKAYKQMKEEMLAELEGGVAVATSQLARMTRLLMLASAYGEIDPDTGVITMADPSCKVDALMDVVDELDSESLVVFAQNRQLIDLASARLTKAGVEHGLITGQVPDLARAQAVTRFQNGEFPLILCTIDAGGEGLTLTKARHVVFLQRSFSHAKNIQAEDRVWRRGQDRPVQPIIIVARETVESRVLAIGREKEIRLEEVVRDGETLRKFLED